jgi:hypothetical protein
MIAARAARWTFVCILGIAAQAPLAAASAEPNLRYAKAITTPALNTEELLAVILDSDVFAATQDGFADLRILDAGDRETAFILRPATETRAEKVRRIWSPRKPRIKLLENDGLEITLELVKDDPTPHGMRLLTPLTNFEQRVQVFTSSDSDSWTPLLEDGVIFDYSQFMDVRNDSLEFPAAAADGGDNSYRHFRILIDDVTKDQQSQLMELTRRLQGGDETNRSERVVVHRHPLRIDRIEFWRDEEHQSVSGKRQIPYLTKSETAKELADENQTIVTISARREPLTSLRLETSDRNFSRTARVEALRQRGQNSTWETLGSATVSRLDFRELKRESLDIAIPETRETNLRFVVENGDNAPLNISRIATRGPAYEVVFMGDPKASYRLAYGNATIEPPSYDTAAIAASLAANYKPLPAELGKQSVLSAEAPSVGEPVLARLLNSPIFLTLAIALLALALGIGLYRASRRLDNLPQ